MVTTGFAMDDIVRMAVHLTQELVRVPSESSEAIATDGPPEAGVAALLQKVCSEHGVFWQRQAVFPGRDNFVSLFPQPGAPRVLFAAHMDTVSGKGMEGPFSAELRNNRVWGRGACDDKGSLATVLAVLISLKNQGVPLRYQVTLAATVDEERTMSGAAVLAKNNPGGWDLCVGMEPTLLQPISAHRGAYRCRILAPDKGELEAGTLVADLRRFGEALSENVHPKLGKAVMTVTEIPKDQGGSHRVLVDLRLLPGQLPARIHAYVGQLVASRGKVIPLFAARGIDSDPDNHHIHSFQASLARAGQDASLKAVPYTTDCSQLQDRGPCLVWGPGDPLLAHHHEESIAIEDLAVACRVLFDFFARC